MSNAGKWIYNLAGDGQPGDAPEYLDTRDQAIAAALANYWDAEAREGMRKRDLKLQFHVGLVSKAQLVPIHSDDVLRELMRVQVATADVPADWPDVSDEEAKAMEYAVHQFIGAWLKKNGALPDWDAVMYEKVEVPA